MNTILTPVVDCNGDFLGYDFQEELAESAIKSIARNNTFMPNIDRVIYNTNVESGKHWTLVTVVYFKDGTKVTVKNSERDDITLVERQLKLSDGTEKTIRTASEQSKEIGLVYALAKRLICTFDERGTVSSKGFAGFLHKTIDKAHVQDVEDIRIAAERKIAKARHEDNLKAVKARKAQKKSTSLKDMVADLSSAVSSLKDVVSCLVSRPSAVSADEEVPRAVENEEVPRDTSVEENPWRGTPCDESCTGSGC